MPTVVTLELNADKYHSDLAKAVAESRAAAEQLSAIVGSATPSAEVKVDSSEVDEAIAKVDDLKKNDGKSVNISVNVEQSGNIDGVADKLAEVKKTVGQAPKRTFFGALGGEIKGAWKAMTDFGGGAKKLTAVLGTGAGAIGAFAAGAASLVKLGVMAYDAWRSGLQEASEQIQRNVESVREAAEANEQLRQKSDGYANRLSELSKQERLSNADKVEAIKLIKDLSGAYGDLGVKIDATTGKLVGVDEAMAEKLRRDKKERLGELRREIKNLEADNKVQAERRDTAGVPVWFDGDTRLGGRDEVRDASKKNEENTKRLIELRRKYREVLREDKAGDYLKKREGEKRDIAEAKAKAANEAAVAARRQRFDREHAGAIADEKDPAKRRAMLEEDLRREKDEAARHRAEANKPRTVLDFESAAAALAAAAAAEKKYQESLQRQYELQRQINAEKKKEAEFTGSLADKAKDLAARVAERAGRGREYAEQRALEAAEKRKGGKLTAGESDAVKRLSALEYDMSHADKRGADLAIKTNSLTARGGFRTGAVVPDAQKYTKLAVDVAKRQLTELGKIGQVIAKWDSGG